MIVFSNKQGTLDVFVASKETGRTAATMSAGRELYIEMKDYNQGN